MESYKLTYFPARGAAENIRLMFAYGGIKYEDERIAKEDWPALKEGTPFGQLPLLTVNGKKFSQSIAIARFVAKKAKLVGKDSLEDLEIDGVVDTLHDLAMKASKVHYEQDVAKKLAIKESIVNESVPFYYDRLEALIKKNNGYLACKKLTWADLYAVPLLESFELHLGVKLTKYPNLEAMKNKVLGVPAIKKWVDSRPASEF